MQPAIDLLQQTGQIDKTLASQFVANNQLRNTSQKESNLSLEETNNILAQIALQGQKTASILQEGHQKIQKETKNTAEGFDKLSGSLEKIGGALGIAFGVAEIVRFGNESVNAYAKAQQSALQLLGALNGNAAAQGRMLELAKQLGEKFAIPQSVITAQEKFLAINGRTEQEIEKVIKAAIELSAVTGEDLQSSVFKLNATYEGSIGRLGKLDKGFKDLSKTQLENGEGVDLILEKYKGFAEKGLEGATGEMQRNAAAAEELSVRLGEKLAPAVIGLKTIFLSATEGLVDFFTTAGGLIDNSTLEGTFKARFELVKRATEEAKTSTEDLNKEIQKLNAIQGSRTGDERTKVLAQIAAYQAVIKERTDAANKSTETQVITLQSLKEKLEDLKKQQEKVADPLGAGKENSDKILAQITSTQSQIDEITGKAQEERNKKAAEEQKQADADSLEEKKKIIATNTKSAEDSHKIDLSNLESAKQDEIGLEERSAQEKLLIDLKYLEEKKKLSSDDPIELAKIGEEEKAIEQKLNQQKIEDAKKTGDAVSKQHKDQVDKDLKADRDAAELKQKIGQLGLETAQKTADTIFTIANGNIEAESDARIAALEKRKNTELANTKLTSAQKAAIEKNYATQEAKIKHDAAIKERSNEKTQAEINGLLAITNILATSKSPLLTPFLIAAAIATTALQVAAISSKPLPQYHTGRLREDSSMEELAIIRRDETIFDPQQSREYHPLFSAIKSKKISPELASAFLDMPQMKIPAMPEITEGDLMRMLTIHNSGITMDYDKLGSAVAKHILKASEETNHRNRYGNKPLKIENIDRIVDAIKSNDNLRRR